MMRVNLGDVAKESRETLSGSKKGLPVVGLEHIAPGELSLTTWDVDGENTFTKVFRKGQILFGRRRAYLKKAAVAPFDGICSGDITVIEALPDRLSPELLPFIIQNDTFFDYAVGKSAGSLSPRAKWEHLRDFELNVPPLAEQRKLADLLWAANTARVAYKHLLAATDELVKSRFVEMFGARLGDGAVELSEICTIITDGTHQPPKFIDTGIPFLLVSNIVDNEINYTTSKFISRDDYDVLIKRTPIEVGDVLLTTVGSYGNPAVVKSEQEFCFQRHIAYLKPKQKQVNSVYLHAVFLSSAVREQIEVKVKGIAQKTLNLSELKTIRVNLPPLDLQTRFADFVRQADKSKFTLQQTIDELEATYKSLLRENLG